LENSQLTNSSKRIKWIPADNETLDNYFAKPLNNDQQKKLNHLLLRATISCGFAFHWIENPEVKALFKYINPSIELPRRS
ncbi:7515_t:CDS:1, partial [Acaulospora morrowiae]